MYAILTAVAVGALSAVGLSFAPWMSPIWAGLLGLVVAFTAMALITRRLMRRIEPIFVQAQKLAQIRQFPMALKELEKLEPLARWQILLGGQIEAQRGIIYYAQRDENKALEHLSKAGLRIPDAQLILAGIHFRRKEPQKAFEVLETALKVNRKQALMHNAYAFMLERDGQGDKAYEVLQKAIKTLKTNDATSDNMLRLQNGKKMNMKPFGMSWYSVQLEKPPMSMMQDQFSGRPGFRQKRKSRG